MGGQIRDEVPAPVHAMSTALDRELRRLHARRRALLRERRAQCPAWKETELRQVRDAIDTLEVLVRGLTSWRGELRWRLLMRICDLVLKDRGI